MARVELTLPAMGEGIIEAAITRWLVASGQYVKTDQPMVEVATDKVDSEVPSPVDGKVVKLLYLEGEIPKVGEVIALIETDLSSAEAKPEKEMRDLVQEPDGLQHQKFSIHEKRPHRSARGPDDNPLISPLVRLLARQRGISSAKLGSIKGTGLSGRITKHDIDNYILMDQYGAVSDEPANDNNRIDRPDSHINPPPVAEPGDEVVEMSRLRRLIADNMMRSMRTAAHVTSFLEADVTYLVAWRDKHKEEFMHLEAARLTFTPLIIAAVCRALKDFPRINVSVTGDSLIIRKNINIGFATALPDGNLIVPVIRNADHESLGSLARKVSDMADRARNNALLPAEIKGGTFTITNIGQYNNLTGTPIINQPESAILAVGTIIKKPWAIKAAGNWGMAVRDIAMLSLTYDHRVIDGALGGSFLNRVVSYLEHFEA
jgi:2-oxoglutarate dehydrogenase E2 component (dihydrolipoamide succinyltransferase)